MGRNEDLVALDEEVSCLEVHIQEVQAGKRAVESLDAETAEAAEAAQRVAERVSAEERKKAQLEQQGAGLSAASRDPAALKRTLVVLRKRNKALQHLHNPVTTIKEEEVLTRQHQDLAKLMKSRQVQSRELKQRVRQVEVAQAHADQERLLGGGDAAKQFEAYISRLMEMERRGREACEQRAEVAEGMEREWGRWLELLCACARTLRARADGGEEEANLGDTETPAASVLESVHRSEARRNQLKLELRECEVTERALQDKIQKMRGKIAQHASAATAAKGGGAGISSTEAHEKGAQAATTAGPP